MHNNRNKTIIRKMKVTASIVTACFDCFRKVCEILWQILILQFEFVL